jgi:glycosyltransferase involved in cell wall biosynthesis
MAKKRKLLIVTANDYLIYQPTILNLYDFLEPEFDVTILSFEPSFVSTKKDEKRNAEYISISAPVRFVVTNIDSLLFKMVRILKRWFGVFSYDYTLFQRLQLKYLKSRLKPMRPDRVIAVDIASLYASQQVFGKVEFLSLEIYPKDPYKNKINTNLINSVFIQNKIRFEHLFNGTELRRFYVQNAPVFKETYVTNYERKGLVWAGSILKRFAVLDCIDFIEKHQEYTLVLKGGAEEKTLQHIKENYAHLFTSGNLVLDQVYLEIDAFIDYLAHFRIGFCFYSWELINSSFNYQSAPSGKLFMCLAAGVPVIASDIPGFAFVKEFNAGVLVKDYKAETIQRAIQTIESDYETYRRGCYTAARHFDFKTNVDPYVRYLAG